MRRYTNRCNVRSPIFDEIRHVEVAADHIEKGRPFLRKIIFRAQSDIKLKGASKNDAFSM